MARSYAQILTTIWADPDWRALTTTAQHAYMLLLSQPTLDFAGVAPLQVRKWSGHAADLTPDALHDALDELAKRRFVVLDHDTEEVLVRSFIRNSEVWKQPNVVRRSLRDAVAAVSPRIRAALAAELGRIPWGNLSGKRADDTRREARDAAAALTPETLPGRDGETPPERVPETLPERVQQTPQEKGSANPSQKPEEGFAEPRGTGTGTGTPPVSYGFSSLSEREEKFAETITSHSDAAHDEVPGILAHIRATHAPDSLGAWLRAVAARGDLQDVIDAARNRPAPDVAPRNRPRCTTHMLALPCASCAADQKAAS